MATQVGLKLSAENLQRGTFSNTVGSDKTENLARSGHRQTVELEAVGAITVGDLALEVGGQVDDGDGVEGALLGADTATNTQAFGDESDLGGVVDFDAEFTGTDDGARLLALLTTFLDESVIMNYPQVATGFHTFGLHCRSRRHRVSRA